MNIMQYITEYDSPLGTMLLASDGDALTGLWFTEQKYYAQNLSPAYIAQNCQVFAIVRKWLDIYFNGKEPEFTPPLKLIGSEFRLAVWNLLLEIPYGSTITYGEIAMRIAHERGNKRMSAQAVGGAVGHNPIGIIVPCHRVVGSNGNLTGYAGGIAKKQYLLKTEHVDLSKFFEPKKGTAL